MSETTTAVEKAERRPAPARDLRTFLDKHIEAIGQLLPKGDDPKRYVAATAMAIAQNPKLAEADPVSVLLSVQRIAQWGLEIGVTAYLVPRWNGKLKRTICQPQTHYKGEIEMVVAAKGARAIRAQAVYEGEAWEHEEGLHPILRHVPDPAKRRDPSKIVRTYAIADHGPRALPTFAVAERFEIERRRQSGGNADGDTWTKHYEAMAIKCAIRMLTAKLPKNARLASLYATEDTWDETVEQAAQTFGADTLPAPAPARRLGSGTLPSDYTDARPAYAGPEPTRVVATTGPLAGDPLAAIHEHERDPYGLEGDADA